MRVLIFAPPKKADPLTHALKNRQALLRRERAASRQIEKLYRGAKASIEPQLKTLTSKIAEARKLKIPVGVGWLENEARLTALLAQIELQIAKFAGASAAVTESSQRANVVRGVVDAFGGLREAAKYAGINATFDRLPAEALEDLAGFLADGSPLAKLFGTFGREARQAASQSLFTGLAEGKSPVEIGRAIRTDLGVSKARALLISRTESLRAYRSATQREYAANSDVVTGWRWTCSYSVRTCAMCIAMDGTEHPVTEQLASHPACRCTETPILEGAKEQERTTGPEWFAGQDAETQDTILGPLKGRLYRSGDIELGDLVKQGRDAEWGDWRAEKSVRDLVRDGSVSQKQVSEAAKAAGV